MKEKQIIKQLLFIALLCIYTPPNVFAYTQRDLLQNTITLEELKSVLLPNQEWVEYPAYTDRTGWDNFLGNYKDQYIRRGEKQLDYQWKVVKATDYLAFERTGNRQVMEKPFDANNRAISDLLLAELAEGKGRFLDALIDGVFHSCEMSSWALSAHLIVQPSHRSLPSYDYPLIDLTAGDLGGLLSWTYYFMNDSFTKVNPEISRRLRHELQTRILDPYMENDKFWWMAVNYKGQMVNNWNPWCNSNALMCFMLLENDRDKLAAAVYRSMQSVDKFINYTHSDGACEEGPSYWGHASGKMLDYLELLSNLTAGKVNIFHQPMIKSMGEYISRSYVGNRWVVNFADASAHGDGNSSLIYRFGKAVDSDELKGFAALMNTNPSSLPNNGRDIYRTLAAISVNHELQQIPANHVTPRFTWYPETEFCYISTSKGVFLAAKGGYNNESHNHNDAGTCSVWMDQTPVLIDAGVGTYTRQTFSSERYSIWTMQSDYHNLPMINGVAQRYGAKYKATEVAATPGNFKANIATAYPQEAKVKSWIRSYKVKGNEVQMNDAFELTEAIAPNIINFMTWGEVDSTVPGKVSISIKEVKAQLSYDSNKFKLTIEPIELTDKRLSNVWGSKIYRLSFTATQQKTKGNYSFTIKKQ